MYVAIPPLKRVIVDIYFRIFRIWNGVIWRILISLLSSQFSEKQIHAALDRRATNQFHVIFVLDFLYLYEENEDHVY